MKGIKKKDVMPDNIFDKLKNDKISAKVDYELF